jgi:ribonuclease PH
MRHDGRTIDQLRNIKITRRFTEFPAGSVLWEQGKTIVLCTASVAQEVPPWFSFDKPGGWVTAEYVMLPASTPQHKRWPKIGHTDGRGTEIQRLIGRAIRAAVDLNKIGPHTIALDCQVLQADGGTRTASISAAYVALADAIGSLPAEIPPPRGGIPPGGRLPARFDPARYDPKGALVDQLAAISVGLVDGETMLDLDYHDDSRASLDMNVAATARGKIVEVQAGAENGEGFHRGQLDKLLDLALAGCQEVMQLQRAALSKNFQPVA